MATFRQLTVGVLLGALTLGACAGAAPGPTAPPTNTTATSPPAATAATTPSQPANTPTPATAATATSAPTVAATPTVQAVVEVAAPVGTASWGDQTARNDVLRITVDDLPSPSSGEVYGAWLVGEERNLFLGTLGPGEGGGLTLTYVAPDQANLLGRFEKVSVTRVAEANADQEIENVVAEGALPDAALVHIRHVLVSIDSTPDRIGFVLGLRKETDEVLRHAQFLKEAFDESDLALEKLHAEHLVNMIEGAEGEHYGDLNGNGQVDNPGDGFGILENGGQSGYVKGMNDHARLAAEASDATDTIKLHAGHVQIAGENTRVRVAEIRDRALEILDAGGVAETEENVLRILALSQQTIQGQDLNADEQVAPVPGEGGVLTAYQHAQLMASIALVRAEAAAAPAPQSTPVAQPTATPPPAQPTATPAPAQPTATPSPAAATEVEVVIGDSSFTPREIRVPVGATVIWVHQGRLPHTVTADDGSFKSDTLNSSGAFRQTFTQAGELAYHCEFHGGNGGVGMSGTIVVGD